MRVLFDHQIFSSQVFGGVSKYFAEVIHRLPDTCWDISAWLSNNEYARHLGLFEMTPFLPGRDFRGKGRIMAELGKLHSLRVMRRGEFDMVHQTNFDTYLFKAIKGKPMITTYHDTNFVTEYNYNPRMKRLQEKSLQRADAIIAVSENTRRDMLSHFNVDESKVTVIHHGIDVPKIPAGLEARVVPEPYILYVGMRHRFKNFINFIRGFGAIAARYPGLKVVCTRSPFTKEEQELFTQLGIADRMQVVTANEVTLNRLYRDAMFFVFPSLYEGFGMPILEAMANGCPTAIADASCFPEIGGDASLYFDPRDIDSIAHALETMVQDDSLRQDLIRKGLERSALFTWQRTADRHLALYQSLT